MTASTNKWILQSFILVSFTLLISCHTSQPVVSTADKEIHPSQLGGGSSGMEQIDDHSYLVVYDLKSHQDGARLAKVEVEKSGLRVSPVHISEWGEEGIANDLESICKVVGRPGEYLFSESGYYAGKYGRIFHARVDTSDLSAKILGTTHLPLETAQSQKATAVQYEAMACLPYDANKRILILAERGGSKTYPTGIIRWGIYDLETHQLKFSASGSKGIQVNAPGEWTDAKRNRDISDLHIDSIGGIWASASEEVSEMGPFNSVIYKVGEVNMTDKERPFSIYGEFPHWRSISGFKVEGLSGPTGGIQCTHTFGTEDEDLGGVWRPIVIE